MFKVNPVSSNQQGPHSDLLDVVSKQQVSEFLKPISQHTEEAFAQFSEYANAFKGGIIIDACCGVGESTLALSKQFPECLVVGIDKSIARLDKNAHYYQCKSAENGDVFNNVMLLRADLNDFWRLLSTSELHHAVKKQFILYPNPYPKKAQLGKRWYASPIMKNIVSVSTTIECRSNWLIYLEEFQQALSVYKVRSEIVPVATAPITPFERKYLASGQNCWKLTTICD